MLLQIIPSLLSIITAVEETVPEAGKGAEKLALIKEMMNAIYDGLGDIWPAVENLVTVIVAFLNKIGVFKTSS